MAKIAATNCGVWVGGYETTGTQNSVNLELGADTIDITCFGDLTRTALASYKGARFSHAGIYDASVSDLAHFDSIGVQSQVVTIAPARTAGEVSFIVRSVATEYNVDGRLGGAIEFTGGGQTATGSLVRSTIMDIQSAATATGNGTARQVGAASASQSMFAALHVVAASGTSPTLDVIVESDDASGMSTPTTQMTFTQATAIGSEWQSAAGAITDDWWRISWTIGGTSPSFDFVVSIGVEQTDG